MWTVEKGGEKVGEGAVLICLNQAWVGTLFFFPFLECLSINHGCLFRVYPTAFFSCPDKLSDT